MEADAKKIPSAQEYLYAMIRCAEWVSDDYKKLAEKNKEKLEILKELYLCACDGVPVEKVQGALEQKKSSDKMLHAIRKKCLEESLTTDYEKEISKIQKKAAALEKNVNQMKDEVKDIKERMPTLESAFPEQRDMEKAELEAVPISGKSQEQSEEPENRDKPEKKENVPKFGTGGKSLSKFDWIRQFRVKAKRRYIEYLLQEGYDKEQLSYLMDCLEKGMTPGEIEKIASPKLPVEIMERLRQMESD